MDLHQAESNENQSDGKNSIEDEDDRGGGRYEKLVVLLFTDPNRNVGGAKGCLLSKITKVGGAIAPPAPPVPPPLWMTLHQMSNHPLQLGRYNL